MIVSRHEPPDYKSIFENIVNVVCDYIKTCNRDNKKKNLCEKYNIKLLYYSNMDAKHTYQVIKNKTEL